MDFAASILSGISITETFTVDIDCAVPPSGTISIAQSTYSYVVSDSSLVIPVAIEYCEYTFTSTTDNGGVSFVNFDASTMEWTVWTNERTSVGIFVVRVTATFNDGLST